MNITVDPHWGDSTGEATASDRGQGVLGFAGTVEDAAITRPAGLTASMDTTGESIVGMSQARPCAPVLPENWRNRRDPR